MATIRDVAKRAGVAVTTVSRVLNNRGYISEETRRKVYAAMDELGYRPNEIARALQKQRSFILGLIVPTVKHPFFGALVHEIERVAAARGYKLMLTHSLMEKEKEAEYLDLLRRHRVDGIVLGSHTLEVDVFRNVRLPLVTFDRRIGEAIPFICPDNYEGGRLATEHLIARGARKIVYLSGPLSFDMLSNRRHQAYVDVVRAHGRTPIVYEFTFQAFESPAEGRYGEEIARLFHEHPDVDGIFASSDILAYAAMHVARRLGRKVPEDVKIVGFDDLFLSQTVVPPLTTVRQPIPAMAERAVEVLERQIAGGAVEIEHVFPVDLIVRGTT
ncbi:MAG: LacI family DNA-binding transcriptional regulator [Hydrogenibacillus sp.]|nr:LacI family DNA-binding transcriptional regulator [Hydrogenibacillus sp.]